MPEETVTAADMAMCDCAPCQKKRGLPHNIRSMRMHEYSSRPRGGWRPRYTRDEAILAELPATFGVELETDSPQRPYVNDLPNRPQRPDPYDYATNRFASLTDPRYAAAVAAYDAAMASWRTRQNAHVERTLARATAQGDMTADEAISMAGPRGFWHAKHDSSVTGPEFASQPGSLAYWRGQRPRITGMMKALLHGGMRSHDGARCGMHVNIGNDAFSVMAEHTNIYGETSMRRNRDADHLFRFMSLVAANPRWSTRMAQRTHEQVNSWCGFSTITDPSTRRTHADNWARNGSSYTGHSSAVNLSNEGRVEFRLPRGTLRVDRFYAKLEWVAAMVEYTRNPDNATNVPAFISWVRAQGTYPQMETYMREKFSARFAEPVAA